MGRLHLRTDADSAPPLASDVHPASRYADLTSWKITVPIGHARVADRVLQAGPRNYVLDPWFVPTATCDGVRFRAPHFRAHHLRLDLIVRRFGASEMTHGRHDPKAAWFDRPPGRTACSSTRHHRRPPRKKHVGRGQIPTRATTFIVIRLNTRSCFIAIRRSDGPTPRRQLIAGANDHVEFVASGGASPDLLQRLEHTAYTPEPQRIGFVISSRRVHVQSQLHHRSNAGQSCGESNYGEVEIPRASVRHD
jgi:hypothetical protein